MRTRCEGVTRPSDVAPKFSRPGAGSMAGAAGSMGGAIAATAAASALTSLSGFTSQIKNKDDVTFEYQLVQVGQQSPRLNKTLKAKAKSDGEDVLTPLIEETAGAVLTEVTTKK